MTTHRDNDDNASDNAASNTGASNADLSNRKASTDSARVDKLHDDKLHDDKLHDDELHDNERAELPPDDVDAWLMDASVVDPPTGFATRVVARHTPALAPSSRPKGPLAVAGALLVTLLVVARLVHMPTSGHVEATARHTVAIDDQVTMVVEKNAILEWSRAISGATVVDLTQGRVFFRVDEGPFNVHVPGADIVVTGTCFTVEVPVLDVSAPGPLASKKSLAASFGAGLVVGAAALLTVHEGSVVVHGRGDAVKAVAGDVVSMPPDGAPSLSSSSPMANAAHDAEERARLKTQIAELDSQLGELMRAAANGQDPVVAENARLTRELRAARDSLSSYQALEKETEGRPFKFPDDLDVKYRSEAVLKDAVLGVLKAAGVPGDVTSIDCAELPCIVYGEANGDEIGREALDQRLLTFGQGLRDHYGPDHDSSVSMWRSSHDDKNGVSTHRTHFAVGVAPDDVVPEDQVKDLRHRTGFRMQQYGNSLVDE